MNMHFFKKRQRARKFAVQALYSYQIANNNMQEVLEFYQSDRNPEKYDALYFRELSLGVVEHQDAIDSIVQQYIEKSFSQLFLIDLSIMRVAIFELMYSIEVPYKVILFEAVEIAKIFGTDDSPKFVNGVLHAIGKTIRKLEYHQLNEA